MFLLTTQWVFNKGIHGAKLVAGLQMFYSLGTALCCPANGHLSHPIFEMYLLCLVLIFFLLLQKLYILVFGKFFLQPCCYTLLIFLKYVLYIQKINSEVEGTHMKQPCILGVKGR